MKNVDININLGAITKSFSAFLRRFHFVLFVVIVGTALAFALLSVSGLLADAETPDETVNPTALGFDKKTIEQVKELRTNTEYQPVTPPEGRTNPFYE